MGEALATQATTLVCGGGNIGIRGVNTLCLCTINGEEFDDGRCRRGRRLWPPLASTPRATVFILMDDLGYNELGFQNSSRGLITPHLDSLAFTRRRLPTTRTSGSDAGALMTGRYNHRSIAIERRVLGYTVVSQTRRSCRRPSRRFLGLARPRCMANGILGCTLRRSGPQIAASIASPVIYRAVDRRTRMTPRAARRLPTRATLRRTSARLHRGARQGLSWP